MRATINSASRRSRRDTLGQFTMLLAISAPIMALYTAGAIDYADMLLQDRPTEVAVELAAPAAMADALRGGVSLPDMPALAFAASYLEPNAAGRIESGETTKLASAATSAIAGAPKFAFY